MKISKLKEHYSYWFCIPAVLVFVLFFILPTLASFALAFTDWSIWNFTTIKYNGLTNFKELLSSWVIGKAIYNTFYFAIVTVLVKTLLGFILALIVDNNLKLKEFYKSVFFMPVTVSPLIVCITFSAIYNPQFGLINTVLRNTGLGFLAKQWLADSKYAMNAICLMDVWQGAGLSMAIFLAGLQSIPAEYSEAAIIDGANFFNRIRHIIVPLIMPATTVNIILSIVGGLKVFTQVYGLTNGGPADQTQVFSMLTFKYFGLGLYGTGSAVGMVSTIIIMLLGFVVLKFLRQQEVEY